MDKPVMPNGKTRDFVWPSWRRCRNLAVDEPLVPMPVAGPNGVVEFPPGSRCGYLCSAHLTRFKASGSDVSMGAK